MTDEQFAQLRSQFQIPENMVYLDGNSLGALPKMTQSHMTDVISRQWAGELVAGWNTCDWIDLPLSVGDQIAPIVGAAAGSIVCCDNLSINLFKALAASLEINNARTLISVEAGQFPTDSYMAQGLASLVGPERCQVQSVDVDTVTVGDLKHSAVLVLSHVDYKTGTLRDMGSITKVAHAAGSLIIWDLAHSAGVVDISLAASEVDFAVGCTYKFLNGGPGAPGFLYVNERHQHSQNPLPGWMGHARLFDFEADYDAAPGVRRFLTGTQSVLALNAVASSLSVFDGLCLTELRQRSLSLTAHFIALWQKSALLQGDSVIVTPLDEAKRGSQVSLALDHAFPISQALIDDGVVVDFREPNLIRFGFSPLYNTLTDAERGISSLESIIASKQYEAPQFQIRSTVT